MAELFKMGKMPILLIFLVGFAGFYNYFNRTQVLEKQLTKQIASNMKYQFETKLKMSTQQQEMTRLEVNLASLKTTTFESKRTITKLTTENRKLTESSKRKWFKLIKPDGTIIEKEYTEENREEVSSVVTSIKDEFSRKVKSIENKWLQVHKTKVAEIRSEFALQSMETLEKHRKEILSERYKKSSNPNGNKYTIRGGYNSDFSYYGGFGYKILGPIFIDSSLSFTPVSLDSGQLGLGISF